MSVTVSSSDHKRCTHFAANLASRVSQSLTHWQPAFGALSITLTMNTLLSASFTALNCSDASEMIFSPIKHLRLLLKRSNAVGMLRHAFRPWSLPLSIKEYHQSISADVPRHSYRPESATKSSYPFSRVNTYPHRLTSPIAIPKPCLGFAILSIGTVEHEHSGLLSLLCLCMALCSTLLALQLQRAG